MSGTTPEVAAAGGASVAWTVLPVCEYSIQQPLGPFVVGRAILRSLT